MPKVKINMISKATDVKGQGVGSAYLEQVSLVKRKLNDKYEIKINDLKDGAINHYHTINPEFYIRLKASGKKVINIAYVHFLPETLDESIHLPEMATDIFYRYVIDFYKSMDYLVTVNPIFIDKLCEYDIPRERIVSIPNYVSKSNFYPRPLDSLSETMDKYGINPDRFVILSVGQTQIRKGILDFVEVAKKLPECQFLWAGGFSFGAITEGHKEIKKVIECPPENVKFLGIVDRAEMNALYNCCDVFFLPSYNELFPMCILEAMCCKKPILLRDIELYEDILFDFYEKGSTNEEFASLIEKLQFDDDYYQAAVNNAIAGNTYYGEDNIAKMWDEFYSSCLERGKQKKTLW